MSLGDNKFNNDTPTMDESDSSSQPPPGRPGDTEDFFVPYYQINSDNSQQKMTKAKIRANSNNNNIKSNQTIILGTYSDNKQKQQNDNNKSNNNNNNNNNYNNNDDVKEIDENTKNKNNDNNDLPRQKYTTSEPPLSSGNMYVIYNIYIYISQNRRNYSTNIYT